ncbi:MAG TPA: porin, partial [Polyangiaceae bacterium]|nr:porin [Polyangiaceae bacterium]
PAGTPPAAASTAAPTTPAPAPPPPVAAPPAPPAEPLVEIGGYAQVEYQSHADSEEQLAQGSNTTLNQNRFLVRRARLIAKRAWEYTSLELELDGNTVSGPSFGLYRAEASAYYRPDKTKAPWVQLTLGMFRMPFGFELPQSSGARWFMERSQVSRALFPSEIDLGGRLSGEAGPFRYAAALTNGEPLGEKSGFALQDPNKNKDLTVSVGAKGDPLEFLTVGGGVSANTGRGFHPGTSATKPTMVWSDRDDNGAIGPNEIEPIAGRAAVKSETFERWAVGGDIQLEFRTPLGATTLYGEMVVAKNLDRGFFPADPVSNGADLREFGYFIGILQEVTKYGMVGFRIDYYDPNADSTDRRAGKTLPAENTVTTYSPLVGVTLPKRARLCFQYDIIKDYLARDLYGVPTNLENNAWTLRLQVNL